MKKEAGRPRVSQIRIGEHDQPKQFIRVVFDLKKVGEHRVENIADRIVVSFGAAGAGCRRCGRPRGSGGSMTTLNAVGAVTCRPHDAVTRLEIRTAVKPDYTIVDSGDPAKDRRRDRQRENCREGRQEPRSGGPEPRRRQGHRVPLCQGRRPVRPRGRAAAPAGAVPRRRGGPEGRGRFREVGGAAPQPRRPARSALPRRAQPAARAAAVGAAPEAPVAADVRLHRQKLSLDFKDAEVNDILRLISEVSGLNFVAGTEVKGSVTIKLADVPWDLALDLILKTNNPPLAQIRESDNIVRITTIDKLRDEAQRRRAPGRRQEEGRTKSRERASRFSRRRSRSRTSSRKR